MYKLWNKILKISVIFGYCQSVCLSPKHMAGFSYPPSDALSFKKQTEKGQELFAVQSHVHSRCQLRVWKLCRLLQKSPALARSSWLLFANFLLGYIL